MIRAPEGNRVEVGVPVLDLPCTSGWRPARRCSGRPGGRPSLRSRSPSWFSANDQDGSGLECGPCRRRGPPKCSVHNARTCPARTGRGGGMKVMTTAWTGPGGGVGPGRTRSGPQPCSARPPGDGSRWRPRQGAGFEGLAEFWTQKRASGSWKPDRYSFRGRAHPALTVKLIQFAQGRLLGTRLRGEEGRGQPGQGDGSGRRAGCGASVRGRSGGIDQER